MSDNRNIRVEFGILNIGGYMPGIMSEDGTYSEIINPIFAHESYKIKTTFNRNIKYELNGEEKNTSSFGNVYFEDQTLGEDKIYYQKSFRRDVLWNFGDGTIIEGANVEHYYKKPGRYKITCTFFDINRLGWTNTYSIIVQVKEIIPTTIRFSENEDNYKTEIRCSKVEKIAKIETLLGKDVDDLKLITKRIFTEEEHKNGIPNSYFDIKNTKNYHLYPYYSFINVEKSYLYNFSEIHSSYINPTTEYKVDYYEIYGKFSFNIATNAVDLEMFILYPFSVLDEDLFTYKCINPCCNILEKEEYIDIKLKKIDSLNEEDGLIYMGKRGFVDIFYKNDIVSAYSIKDGEKVYKKDNTFSFFYDLEEKNIFNDIKSSVNYLNALPIGMNIAIIPNNIDDVKVSLSLNGFLRNINKENSNHVDDYFINAMSKNYSLDGIFMPYIEYKEDENLYVLDGLEDIFVSTDEIVDFKTDEKSYYVPKDIILSSINPEFINDTSKGYQTTIQKIEEILGGTYTKYEFICRDYINHNYHISIKSIPNGVLKETNLIVKRDDLRDLNDLVIPSEKIHEVDVKRLVNVYLSHPMFDESYKLKEALVAVLKNNNILSYILTKSDNFLDDRTNIKTCYLSNLLSTLKMMGEEITDYETSEFEGVNEMRDFVRILSMNHNDLIGHEISKPYDIHVSSSSKGNNVGRLMKTSDKLYISTYKTTVGNDGLGLIMGYKTESEGIYKPIKNYYGTHLILQDKYTNETRIVSFTTIPNIEELLKVDEDGRKYICLKDYDSSWGWNLLLTDRFKAAKRELKKGGLTTSRKKRLETVCEDVINGYYNFYLLNLHRDKERVGNFLDETSITPDVEKLENWTKEWGFVNDVLMKIIIDNAQLRRDIPVIEEENNDNREKVKVLSFKKDIETDEDVNVTLLYGGNREHTLYIRKNANIECLSFINGNKNTISFYLNDFIIKDYGDENVSTHIVFPGNQKIDINFEIDENGDFYIFKENIDLTDINDNYLFSSHVSIEIDGNIYEYKTSIDIVVDIPL